MADGRHFWGKKILYFFANYHIFQYVHEKHRLRCFINISQKYPLVHDQEHLFWLIERIFQYFNNLPLFSPWKNIMKNLIQQIKFYYRFYKILSLF